MVSYVTKFYVCKSQNKCSLNKFTFLFRPILDPGPSQCMPFLRKIIVSSNLTDMAKIWIAEFLARIIFAHIS